MTKSNEYHARCFCGAVNFTLAGDPQAMAYCHCDSCRNWSAGQVSAFTLWTPEQLTITRGEGQIGLYQGNPVSEEKSVVSQRQWCKECGGHLFTFHPTMGLYDVPAALIKGLDFTPAFHVHYQETVQPMHDQLPKFKDLPQQAGGSGIELPD